MSLTNTLSALARAGLSGLSGVFEQTEAEMRADSWQNVAMGFGTSRDKTSGTNFGGPCIPLTDQECADLFQFDDIAGKIVAALPKEAFRDGFCLTGLESEQVKAASDYLERFALNQQCKTDAVWGRCFGLAATWIHVDDGKKPEEPLDLAAIRSVYKLVTVDKRHLQPFKWYTEGPKVGEPELYMLFIPTPHGVAQQAGVIHESRLVIWPGDMTEAVAKIRRNNADYSVLQKPYDALKSSGNTWKAIEILTTDANQAVYKIKNLWRMIASDPNQGEDSKSGSGQPSGALLLRIRFMDLARSVSKAIVLDADGEEFERKASSFTGLADLSDRAWNRVAAAADMPVTILTGQAPAGLNATGASDLRWWYGRVASEQVQTYEPRVKRILQVLLSAQDSGVKLDEESFKSVTITWKPLWAPSAAELQQMQLQWAQTGQVMIQEQMITPEEYALGAPEEWFPSLDRDQRREMVEALDVQGEKDAAAQAEADAEAAAAQAKGGFGGKGGPPAARKDEYSDDQPRDESGKWTDGGGGGSGGSSGGGSSGGGSGKGSGASGKSRSSAAKKPRAARTKTPPRAEPAPTREEPKEPERGPVEKEDVHVAAKWYDKAAAATFANMRDSPHVEALNHYTTAYFEPLNNMLRGRPIGDTHGKTHEEIAEIGRGVEKFIQEAPKFVGTVERGAVIPAKQIARYEVGATVIHNAFTSATIADKIVENFSTKLGHHAPDAEPVVFRMEQKSGVAISKFSTFGAEKEVLLPPGATFRVTHKEQRDGKTYIHLKEYDQ